MVKRKEPSAPSFPREVHLQPATRGTSSSESTGPFVVYFASGYCPGSNEKLSFDVQRRLDRPREHRLVVQKDTVAFVGSTADAEGPPACRYAVGLLDKRSGVMKYAEVNGGNIVRMKPRAQGTNYGPTGHTTELEATAQARRAQNERLVHAFGSTRRQRQMKERDLAQVVGDNVEASDAVKDILSAVNAKAIQAKATRENVLEESASARNIPIHNRDAMTAAQAYRLEDLVPRGAWEAIEDVSNLERAIEDLEYRDNELRAEHMVPEYVLDRLAVITQPRSQAGARRLRALAFLAALIQLYGAGRHQLRLRSRESMQSLAQRVNIQADVLQPLLDKFCTMEETAEGNQVYSRMKPQQTLLRCHLLMTALIAEDYDLGGRQFEALRNTLHLTPGEVVQHYREMGCSIDRVANAVDRAAGPVSPQQQSQVRLLPEGLPGKPAKTLADVLPAIKVQRERKK